MKKIIYGLNCVKTENISTVGAVEIKFEGNFKVSYLNRNFILKKEKSKIRLTPKKNLKKMPNLLFRYKGYIKIIDCKISNESVNISFPYDDHWQELSSDWDSLDKKWVFYVNSKKKFRKLLLKHYEMKEFKNELQ